MVIWYPSLRIIVFSLNHVTISTRQKWWKLNKMKRKSLCKMKQKKKREIKACNGSSFLEIHFPLKSSTVDLSTSDLFWFSIQIISVCRSIYTINTVFISLYRISQKKKIASVFVIVACFDIAVPYFRRLLELTKLQLHEIVSKLFRNCLSQGCLSVNETF